MTRTTTTTLTMALTTPLALPGTAAEEPTSVAGPIEVASAQQRTDSYELTWSLRTVEEPAEPASARLVLEYEFEAFEEIYVGDRLWSDWSDDPPRRRVPDPFGVYRFVSDDSLWLVFAMSPLPEDIEVNVVFAPLYTRIRAGETHRRTIAIALPVAEYSALARNVDAPSTLEEVSKVTLVLSYRLRSSLEAESTPPPRGSVESGYRVHNPRYIVSTLAVAPLPVRRRTGKIPRFALPHDDASR